MSANLKLGIVFVVSAGFAFAPISAASAVTVEVARQCGALADKAFPLRVPGNPAAGRVRGTPDEFRSYFNKCLANGGKVEDPASEQDNGKNPQAPREGSGDDQPPGQAK
jgi:hypothetical protein